MTKFQRIDIDGAPAFVRLSGGKPVGIESETEIKPGMRVQVPRTADAKRAEIDRDLRTLDHLVEKYGLTMPDLSKVYAQRGDMPMGSDIYVVGAVSKTGPHWLAPLRLESASADAKMPEEQRSEDGKRSARRG